MKHIIYVARDTQGLIKIGRTYQRPQVRLRGIERECNTTMTLIRTFACGAHSCYFEREAFAFCSEHHVYGEWFDLPLGLIDSLIEHLSSIKHIPRDRNLWPAIPWLRGPRGPYKRALKMKVTAA